MSILRASHPSTKEITAWTSLSNPRPKWVGSRTICCWRPTWRWQAVRLLTRPQAPRTTLKSSCGSTNRRHEARPASRSATPWITHRRLLLASPKPWLEEIHSKFHLLWAAPKAKYLQLFIRKVLQKWTLRRRLTARKTAKMPPLTLATSTLRSRTSLCNSMWVRTLLTRKVRSIRASMAPLQPPVRSKGRLWKEWSKVSILHQIRTTAAFQVAQARESR